MRAWPHARRPALRPASRPPVLVLFDQPRAALTPARHDLRPAPAAQVLFQHAAEPVEPHAARQEPRHLWHGSVPGCDGARVSPHAGAARRSETDPMRPGRAAAPMLMSSLQFASQIFMARTVLAAGLVKRKNQDKLSWRQYCVQGAPGRRGAFSAACPPRRRAGSALTRAAGAQWCPTGPRRGWTSGCPTSRCR